ncbi:MAG: acetyl-CoA carboxylase biotin carboxyl carrier protein subunit, partial [Thiohalomonadales bacterium]
MDIRKIKKLIELLEESGITELEIKEGEESVRISRNNMSTAPITYMPMPAAGVAMPMAPPPLAGVGAAEQAITADETEELSGHIIKSPMVG